MNILMMRSIQWDSRRAACLALTMMSAFQQLRSEVERVSSDCSAVKNRLASVQAVSSGLEVLDDPQASFMST